MSKLYIKNMVCNRCIMAVSDEVKKLGVHPIAVSLGEVELMEPLTETQMTQLRESLEELGFEILDDPNKQIIEAIKKHLIEQVQSQEIEGGVQFKYFFDREAE